MNIFIKFLLLIVILACAAPFFLKDPDGEALLSMDKIDFPSLPSLTDVKSKSSQLIDDTLNVQKLMPEKAQIYTWVDKKGVTHFSDKNDDRFSSKLVKIKPINTLPAHKSEIPEASETSDSPFAVTTIPLQEVSKLIDDTQQVKKLMENRENQIEQALQ